MNPEYKILFAAAVASATSESIKAARSESTVYFIKPTGATGGTVALQALSPAGDWHTFHTSNLTDATIEDPKVLDGRFDTTRAVLTWVDGSVNVSASTR